VIEEANVPYKGIDISYIGYTNADGEPFTWNDGTEYAIVSFKAVNEYKFKESVEDFKNEDYDSAINYSLTWSVSVDRAQKLSKGLSGSLTCHWVKNSEDIDILVPKNFVPVEAIVAKKRSLTDILAKSDSVKATA
jgi:hypothetical protein